VERRNRTSRSDAALGLHALGAKLRQFILQWMLLISLVGAPVWVAYSWHAYVAETTEETRYYLGRWLDAWVWADGLHQPRRPIPYIDKGVTLTLDADSLRNWEPMLSLRDQVWVHVEPSLKSAGVVAVAAMIAAYLLMMYVGRRLRSDQHLRGARIVSPSRLGRMLRRNGPVSLLRIGPVSLKQDSECQHIALIGTTGTGKSVAFGELLDGVGRAWPAVVYDTKGEFLAQTYDAAHDVILNPLDVRCPAWTPWDEVLVPTDAWRVAKSMVASQGSGDQFWIEAARQLFVDILLSVDASQQSNGELYRLCAVAETTELETLLRGTPSGRVFGDPAADKMRESIRNTLITSVRCLQLLDPHTRPGNFSVAKWVHAAVVSKGAAPRAFVLSPPELAPAIEPIIGTWVEAAAAAILALGPSSARRILFAIDELPTLPVLTYFARLAAEGRGYGASLIVAVQSHAQLRQRYGADGADALAALFSTRVLFRAADSESAERASRLIGDSDRDIARQSENSGESNNLSVSSDDQSHRVVTETGMGLLPNLKCYLLVPGDFPVCTLRLKPTEALVKAPAYVPRDPHTLIHRPTSQQTPPVPSPGVPFTDEMGPL
jgi:type IV secretory pathway TraG/TraD family ATPase VirD4